MFHFEYEVEKPVDIRSGWITIGEYIEYNECVRFVDFIEKKYGEDYPDFFIIYLEYELFYRMN